MCGGSDDGRKRGMFSRRVERAAAFLGEVGVSDRGAVCERSDAT